MIMEYDNDLLIQIIAITEKNTSNSVMWIVYHLKFIIFVKHILLELKLRLKTIPPIHKLVY